MNKMMTTTTIGSLLLFTITCWASPNKSKDCMDTAQSQLELNQCADSKARAADSRLAATLKAIRGRFKNDSQFLAALDRSEKAWEGYRDAELELKFPATDKQAHYGTVYPMCALRYRAAMVRERIAQLNKWLESAPEGDVCAGSESGPI